MHTCRMPCDTLDATELTFLVRACDGQAAADDNVPTAFVILVKAPEPGFIEGVKNELAGIKDSANAAINDRSATEYVSCVEKMTAMYSKGQGHARMSEVLGVRWCRGADLCGTVADGTLSNMLGGHTRVRVAD